jgi:arylsulfatase A-like enzyme
LGLAGLQAPVWMQGQNCAGALAGQGEPLPELELLEMHNNPRWNLDYVDWRGLVTDRYKYAYYETGYELLFDLIEDPYEMDNLAEARPALRAELRTQLLELLRATREPFFDIVIEHGVTCPPSHNVSGTGYRVTIEP